MRLRCLLIVLIFLAATASDSSGQSKQPSPKASQQKTAQQERGSDDLPVVVKVVPAEKSKDDLAREDAKDKQKLAVDDRVASLTGDLAFYTKLLFAATAVLALITLGLVIVGYRQVRDSRRSIVAAETSAKIAERALTELEAPFIVIKIINPGINALRLDHKRAVELTFDQLVFTISNHGRTPAQIVELTDAVIAVPTLNDIPVLDPHVTRGNPMPFGVIAAPGGESREFATVTLINDMHDGSLAENRTNRAYFRGFVRYRTIFNSNYIVGFCFIFDIERNRWVPMGSEIHNYWRKEEANDTPSWIHPTAETTSVRAAINRAVLESGRDP